MEISNSWSSPTWVVRILDNEKIPYAFNFDLDTTKRKTYTPKTYKYEPYMPPKPVRGAPQKFESIDFAALAASAEGGRSPRQFGRPGAQALP